MGSKSRDPGSLRRGNVLEVELEGDTRDLIPECGEEATPGLGQSNNNGLRWTGSERAMDEEVQ